MSDMLTTLRNEMDASRAELPRMVGGAIAQKAAAEMQVVILQARIRELENIRADLECQLEQAHACLAADDRMMLELLP